MSHTVTGPVYKPIAQGQIFGALKESPTENSLAHAKGTCSRCRGQGFLIINSNTVSLCPCRKSQSKADLLGPALIKPDELGYTFSNYFWACADSITAQSGPGLTISDTYSLLYNEAFFYAKNFSLLRNTPLNSLGLLDRGSFYTRSGAPAPGKLKLSAARQHLLGAVAQHLSLSGAGVLMVEDFSLMALLQRSAREKGGRGLPEILKLLKNAELLIWQDLGRSRMSPASRSHYQEIFSHRRRKNLPVCFSSIYTPALLQHRLGSQSAGSLLSMCICGLHAESRDAFRL